MRVRRPWVRNRMMTRFRGMMIATGLLGGIVAASQAGCSHADADVSVKKTDAIKTVPVTVAPLKHRPVERTVDVVGTLRGWEQVTVGSKKTGRVTKVLHDMGDRGRPDEPPVQRRP